MLALARQRTNALGLNNVSLLEGNAESIPADNDSFDVVLASLSLMYVISRDAAAREIARVLRPGGWLVCEFGLGQDKQMQQVFARAGGYDAVEFANDPQGAPRVVAARRGAS